MISSNGTKTYRDVLREIGWPENVLVLDFETYYDSAYSLSKMTAYEYVEDSRFDILGLAYYTIGGDTPEFIVGTPTLGSLDDFTISCHNAHFDALILARKFGIYPKYIIDTMDLSREYQTKRKHALKSLANDFGLGEKGEIIQFIGKHAADMKEADWIAMRKYATTDVRLQAQLVEHLLPKLSNPHLELRIAQLALEMSTKPVFRCDTRLAGFLIDGLKKKTAAKVAETGRTHEVISGNKSFQNAMAACIGITPYLKQGKKGPTLAISQTDPQRQELLNHENPFVRQLMEARVSVKSTPLHIRRIEKLIRVSQVSGGLLPISLAYHGAATGRDSGSDGMNMQNLPEVVASIVVAQKGYRILSCDLSNIEMRVLAWMAGQENMLAAFREGRDLYKEFAAWSHKKNIEDVTAEERQIAKVICLASGFGMQAWKAGDKTRANTAFEKDGVLLETAIEGVSNYRAAYPKIVRLWYELHSHMWEAIRIRDVVPSKKVAFQWNDDGYLGATLPSGRVLKYHGIRTYGDQIVQSGNYDGGERTLWAGHVTENMVQAIARDVLMEAAVRIDNLGIRVGHRVHDAVLISVKESEAEDVKKIVEEEMTLVPVWATNLPLACKSTISTRWV
jgi:DNA polymerase bacteriophage-type